MRLSGSSGYRWKGGTFCRGRRFLRFWILSLWLAPAVLWLCCSSRTGIGKAGPATESPRKMLCWVLIDFDAIFCSPCLAPFLEFCRILPQQVRQECVRGILIYGRRPQEDVSGSYIRIVRKKMQGFLKANDIGFKIFLDEHHLFNSLAKSNTEVLVFDEKQQMIHRYAIPLRPQEQNEFLGYFTSEEGQKDGI